MTGRFVSMLCICATLAWAGPAAAQQDWPNRPIQAIVPAAAGGVLDTVGRLVAEELSKELGQPVVVENRPGAAGVTAAHGVYQAPGDGYTVLVAGSSVLVSAPWLYPDVEYDRLGFTPIGQVTSGPLAWVVPADFPANNINEFIERIKERPGEYNYGSGGAGGTLHLVAEMFTKAAGVSMTHVPYPSVAQAHIDLIRGEISLLVDNMLGAITLTRNGQGKVLAIASEERSPSLPEVPTLVEEGINLSVTTWIGVVAPPGTPEPIADRLNAAIHAMIGKPEVRARLEDMGYDVVARNRQHFADLMEADLALWGDTIKEIGIQPN